MRGQAAAPWQEAVLPHEIHAPSVLGLDGSVDNGDSNAKFMPNFGERYTYKPPRPLSTSI
jgi:hypothetical protein